MLRTLTAAALLASGLTLGVTAAQADETSSGETTQVPYGDLDLSQPGDAKILANRLQDAANTVCANVVRHKSSETPVLRDCVDEAIRSATSQIEDNLDESAHARVMYVRSEIENGRLED